MTEREDPYTYGVRHRRIYKERGKASQQDCAACADDGIGKRADDWAQLHTEDGEDPWADYVALCGHHHARYDIRGGSKWGRPRKQP